MPSYTHTKTTIVSEKHKVKIQRQDILDYLRAVGYTLPDQADIFVVDPTNAGVRSDISEDFPLIVAWESHYTKV